MKRISKKQAIGRLKSNIRLLRDPKSKEPRQGNFRRAVPAIPKGVPGARVAPNAKDLAVVERQRRAVLLRTAGKPLPEIAEHLGVSREVVVRDLQDYLFTVLPPIEDRKTHWMTEFLRLEQLMSSNWIHANGWVEVENDPNDARRQIQIRHPPSPRHGELVIRSIKLRAELLGFLKVSGDPREGWLGLNSDEERAELEAVGRNPWAGWSDADLEQFSQTGVIPPGKRLSE